jgi:spermidine synthase
MLTDFGEDQMRRLIHDYFGGGARIRLLHRAQTFGAPVFAVDFDRGTRHFRTLGSFGGVAQVTEQSSMDLLYPARLVFHYEQLMSLSFAICRRPVRALLLGVGGAAMWRFLRSHLADCGTTLVDSDETIVAIARRWFHLTQTVAIEPAERFVAATTDRYDVILVDLYGPAGPADVGDAFWGRCLDALEEGGCLACNWADFSVNPAVRPMTEALSATARARGFAPCFVTRRGFRDNLVQYVPTVSETEFTGDGDSFALVLDRFAAEHHLPNRGHGILENCLVTDRFPVD